ncbi:calcium binding protein 39 [Huso huso]|uniref:Calcium binding protein 39 n=1 Tax=Huso huso TaxID=61971 RepID=A0ABR0ZJ78_HUSHU
MRRCSAFACSKLSTKGCGKTFHLFPKNIERQQLWVARMRSQEFKPSNRAVLCSDHFEEAYFDKLDNLLDRDQMQYRQSSAFLIIFKRKLSVANHLQEDNLRSYTKIHQKQDQVISRLHQARQLLQQTISTAQPNCGCVSGLQKKVEARSAENQEVEEESRGPAKHC